MNSAFQRPRRLFDPPTADRQNDLERMFAPLRRLPGISGLPDPFASARDSLPPSFEVQIHFELDARSPGDDFAAQNVGALYRLATTSGAFFPPRVLAELRRLLAHAECVSLALAACEAARRTCAH